MLSRRDGDAKERRLATIGEAMTREVVGSRENNGDGGGEGDGERR